MQQRAAPFRLLLGVPLLPVFTSQEILHLAYVAISYCIAQLFRVIIALLLEIFLSLASVGSVHASFCFTAGTSAFGSVLTWKSERNVVSINQDV